MTPEKRKQLVDRIESKVFHGFSEDEVRDWLSDEMGVPVEDIDELVRNAFRTRKRASATWASAVSIFSIAGTALGIYLATRSAITRDNPNQDSTRTLLFGISFICLGATGLASSLPKLIQKRRPPSGD